MQEGTPQDGGHWYKSTAAADPAVIQEAPVSNSEKTVTWTASEFIAHHKGVAWYLVLVIVTVILGAGAYLLTRDRITTGAIVFCGIVFGIAAARKPRILSYRLDHAGLTVGKHFYPYGDYKAFTVVDEGQFSCISFVPLKRFLPGLNIYYDPDDEERILGLLAGYLPMQPDKASLLDSIIHRLRF